MLTGQHVRHYHNRNPVPPKMLSLRQSGHIAGPSAVLRKINLLRMSPFLGTQLIEGQKTLPDSCPLCEYHPLSPGDCVDNVPLRKTVLAFLRNLELRQETTEVAPLGGHVQGPQVRILGGILLMSRVFELR
jgi:hypothetical protein